MSMRTFRTHVGKASIWIPPCLRRTLFAAKLHSIGESLRVLGKDSLETALRWTDSRRSPEGAENQLSDGLNSG